MDFAADSNATRLEFHTGESATANNKMSVRANGDVNINAGDLNMSDDYGVVFGGGADWWFGSAAGEGTMNIYKGGTQGEGANEGLIQWAVGDSADSYLGVTGGEGGFATIYMYGDQADDNGDKGRFWMGSGLTSGGYWDGVFDDEFYVGDDAIYAEHTIIVGGVDYAEYFEWKVQLADAAAVTNSYGLTVVLDGDKVRLAEAGEEADVIGVVRPSKTSGTVGGDGLYWHGKRNKNIWGEEEKEAYTQVNWHILNEHGNSVKHYSFMQDRIPQYELIDNPKEDVPNWHLLDSNFKRDEDGNKIVLVVPSTDEEKAASRYTERTTHRQTGEPLMRRIINPSYDSDLTYVKRADRRTEWCIVGLLGQVPIRDTAIIPTSWKKMKNLESGIDLYFIK